MRERIQVDDQKFTLNGTEILLRGFGLGNWMNIEHFMSGLPGNDYQKRSVLREIYGAEHAEILLNEYLTNYLTEEDVIFIKSLGLNCVRIPFTHRYFEDERSGEFSNKGFNYIDRLLELLNKHDMYYILALHSAPGGQNPDAHADHMTGIANFWSDKTYRKRVTQIWREIAKYYSDNDRIAGFDILNEPVYAPDGEMLNETFEEIISAIRENDGDRIIFLQGESWAQDFTNINEPQDPQIAFSFHFYPIYTANWLSPQRWTKEDIAKEINYLVKIRSKFNRPVWCGETGVALSECSIEDAKDLMQDTLEVFEELSVSWSLWVYKDIGVMGIVYPKKNTGWMEFVDKVGWDHQHELESAQATLRFMEENLNFPSIPESTKFKLQFRVRGIFHELYLEQMLVPALRETSFDDFMDCVRSFHLTNCAQHVEFVQLIKTLTGERELYPGS